MTTHIRNRSLASDSWRSLDGDAGRWLSPGEDGFVADFPPHADLIVPLAVWRVRRDDLLSRPGRTGVRLEAGDTLDVLAPDLHRLDLVAVDFPRFTDGRGYSTARTLRERYGFRGELRAVGDVLRDQLLALERCGFDAFVLPDDGDTAAALAAFDELSEAYQADVLRPAPLFRRRLAHAG